MKKKVILQQGQAMVETLIILFVTFLLLLGIIQFALIYNAKTTLNYATFEGARAGALNYGDKQAIEFAIARGLSPLYTSVKKSDGRLKRVIKVQSARDRAYEELKQGEFACIERINPPSSAFTNSGHGVPDPTGLFPGERLIPNDHLLYRSAIAKNGLSVQDANLLKIRVTYCYPMYVPIISTTIKRLMGLEKDSVSRVAVGQSEGSPTYDTLVPKGSFHKNCYSKGRFPIVSQAVIRMQTPVRNDATRPFSKNCD
tara:strand:- start:11295 stop:12062 length:768 start_codon:yes stop_codon:yes gene_type:complete